MPRTSRFVTSDVYSGVGDGFKRTGQRIAVRGFKHQLRDALPACADTRLTPHGRAVVHQGAQAYIAIGSRVDASARRQNLRGKADRLGKISCDVRQRGDEQVAEAVALKIALTEAKLKKLAQQVLVLAERHHAVAHIARRQHAQLFAQPPGRSAVVGDGDDGGEIVDQTWPVVAAGLTAGAGAGGCGDKALETAQQGAEPGAAANGNHAQRPGLRGLNRHWR
jgi:hypothetical protein